MLKTLRNATVTVATAAVLLTGSLPLKASASTEGTINTLLGAAAIIGGVVLYNNYEHKKQAANSVVGYTRNGGTIYGDGRIVMPNGQTIHPNSNGQYPWGQYAYYNSHFNGSNVQYDPQRSGKWDHTHHHDHH